MKKLICQYCKKEFEWEHPPDKPSTRPPKICGKAGEDGNWIPTPTCKKLRNVEAYKKWKKKNPQKAKEHQEKYYKSLKSLKIKKSRRTQKSYEELSDDEYSDVPIGKQYPCKRCGRMSANMLYCPLVILKYLMEFRGNIQIIL